MAKTRNDTAENANTLSLLNLPDDIIETALFAQTSINDATKMRANLSRTCAAFHLFFGPILETHATTQLLIHVLQGNSNKAKKIYTNNPGLLFREATATEYAAGINEAGAAVHRTVTASPYRAALGAGDTWMLNDMADCFDNATDPTSGRCYRDIAITQLAQQFPDGFTYPPNPYDFSKLEQAITNDQALTQTGKPSDETHKLIIQFRNDFLPTITTTGHHFNLAILRKAADIYAKLYQQDFNNGQQLLLFSHQIIGYLQRLLSAVDVQTIYIWRNKLPDKLERSCGAGHYPLDSNLKHRLGVDFCVRYEGHYEDIYMEPALCKHIDAHINYKQQALKEFKQRLDAPSKQLTVKQ